MAFLAIRLTAPMNLTQAAQILWDYHHLHHELRPADAIWALGSHDLRVADRVAELWHEGLAPRVILSGGLGNFTEGVLEKPEAEWFAERALELGVPESALLIESRSSNCGENVMMTQALLAEHGLTLTSAIAVQKPYMERRTFATIRCQWPELPIQVTSPQLSFEAYPTREISREEVIRIMVGDLHRLMKYPALGFMIPQEIPPEVMEAFELLVAAGYTGHLLS